MQWDVFISSFGGAALGVVIIGAIVVGWDEISKRRNENSHVSLQDIPEKEVKKHLIDNWDDLFRGWRIYDTASNEAQHSENHRPAGIEFKTERGRIDILCVDRKDTLVVLELKKVVPPIEWSRRLSVT